MTVAVYITDPYGWRIAEVARYTKIECATGLNDVGWFNLAFAAQDFPKSLFFQQGAFAIDRRIEVWRAPRGRDLRLVFCGFIRVYEENAQDYAYTEDYSDEGTFCYAGGSGQAAARTITNQQNDARYYASPLNRREIFYSDTGEANVGVLQSGAQQELYEKRPKIDFAPKNIELTYIYPHDWALGDMLRVNSAGPEEIVIGGPDLNDLFARRVVAAASGSAEAQKNGPADDVMKEYVYENLGAGAAADRQLPAALGFTMAADAGAGQTVDYSSVYGNLLEVLKRVAQRAAEGGTKTYFGMQNVVAGGRVIPHFVTSVDLWGRDLRFRQVGTGTRTQDLEVVGVQLTATPTYEEVVPRFAEVSD